MASISLSMTSNCFLYSFVYGLLCLLHIPVYHLYFDYLYLRIIFSFFLEGFIDVYGSDCDVHGGVVCIIVIDDGDGVFNNILSIVSCGILVDGGGDGVSYTAVYIVSCI